MKVFIVEDNVQLSTNIQKYLKLKGIKAETDFDGNRAFQKILDNHFDVIILDVNLPGMDGFTICDKIRQKGVSTPVLMLTSRIMKDDIIEGFKKGADDYLGKPFDYEELIARLEALNRRNMVNKVSEESIDDIKIDIVKRLVYKGDELVEMSTLEFDLLKYLIQKRGVPVDRKEILENVWGEFDAYMFSRNVDVYIGYLRKKLGKDFIQTRKGYGYVIE